mmetsp:Transcript_8992/g.29977  ORF Transcript_8992/g.29977 Transcript_8992/m.29977 type:complete len:255 (+) Transcript_8992:3573-4337(+)
MPVSVHRVQPVVLQLVCSDLVRQADAPPLLRHVDDGSRVLVDVVECHVQLLLAVTPLRAQYLRREALIVYPHNHSLLPPQVPAHHHHRLHLRPLQHPLAVPCNYLSSPVPVGAQTEHPAVSGHVALSDELSLALGVVLVPEALPLARAHRLDGHAQLQVSRVDPRAGAAGHSHGSCDMVVEGGAMGRRGLRTSFHVYCWERAGEASRVLEPEGGDEEEHHVERHVEPAVGREGSASFLAAGACLFPHNLPRFSS